MPSRKWTLTACLSLSPNTTTGAQCSGFAGIIADAFRIAESGRPGPVWVDVPKDVQAAIIEIDELPPIMPKDPLPLFDAEKSLKLPR